MRIGIKLGADEIEFEGRFWPSLFLHSVLDQSHAILVDLILKVHHFLQKKKKMLVNLMGAPNFHIFSFHEINQARNQYESS